MSLMNSTVYNYFLHNYGYEKAISEEKIALKERFKNSSKKDLKEELKILKLSNASINTIKYIAKSIRSRINKSPINIAIATDNDDEISKNFWGYAPKSVQIRHLCSSIFQRRSGYYQLYQRIGMCKSHESVYNSFLDAQIKRTEYSS